MLKFYWNGIKDDGGKLQTCHYSDGQLVNHPLRTITIYKREYNGFSAGIRAAFTVQNDTEIQSDYIVQDIIRVEPSHPLFSDVSAALAAQKSHYAKQAAKRTAKVVP